MPRPVNRLARKCEVTAPDDLDPARRCERAFGVGGHILAENRRSAVLGPVLIHEYLERDAAEPVVRRWTRFGVLPDRRKTQDET